MTKCIKIQASCCEGIYFMFMIPNDITFGAGCSCKNR